MKYKSVDDILPREQSDVKELLHSFSNLIDEIVNFGTHMMKWETEKKLVGDENIIPLLFLRNILETADAISILIKNSSVDASKSSLRILLENVLSLEYLLEKDTKNRALSFIVWIAHKDLKFYQKLDGNTQVGKQFKAEFKKDSLIKNPALTDSIDYLHAKNNSEELLNLPIYSEVEKEYKRTESKIKNPNWYSLFAGPQNIQQLAKYLNRNAIYEIMYRGYSGNVHATDIYKGKLYPNDKNTVDIVQIRNPKDAQSISIDTVNYLLMSYLAYFKRIPEKKLDFQNWYLIFKKDFDELRNKKYTIEYK
ncbi:hypothetical protein DFQ10_1143 [Winogradskyella eximia]|uniref:Uncharacterized protein n=1 Tax=Winogradskyella eximia TaxID=262006 RepID=A0A3D9GPW1_9FLAO|nr:DUF5677 domain-containing protein [Winogradskyella eximia]RED37917.1 hypothetical protein DFQ10_1143 [Winogradskyella eximia]